MSLRVSEAEAIRRGWINKPKKKSGSNSKQVNTGDGTPQKILFEALKEACPELNVEWEKKKLIPNRRFEVDIFIPPRLAIEVDGFKFHRSKNTFQKDRQRRNIFTENGYIVLQYFSGEIFKLESRAEIIEQIKRINNDSNN